MELNVIKTETTWNDASEDINHNFSKIGAEVTKLGNVTYKNKGYYASAAALTAAHPTASAGSKAYVGTTYPYAVYVWSTSANQWLNSGATGGDESVELGDYYTKEETEGIVEDFHVILSQEAYDALGSYEDKLYFTYEDEEG